MKMTQQKKDQMHEDCNIIVQQYNPELHCGDFRGSQKSGYLMDICNKKNEIVAILFESSNVKLRDKIRTWGSAYAHGKETAIEYIEQNLNLLKEIKQLKEQLEITRAALNGAAQQPKRKI